MTDDLVNVFYRPLVQPLGNLVILRAQADASLLDVDAAMRDADRAASASRFRKIQPRIHPSRGGAWEGSGV